MALIRTHHVQAIAKVIRNSKLSEANKAHMRQSFADMIKTFNGATFNETKFKSLAGCGDLNDFFDGRMNRVKIRDTSSADSD